MWEILMMMRVSGRCSPKCGSRPRWYVCTQCNHNLSNSISSPTTQSLC